MNILRLVLLGLAALAGIVAGAALLQQGDPPGNVVRALDRNGVHAPGRVGVVT